jgi:DNA-binding SARP family transcriptional activator/Flp pilus assembly protein TadD
MFELRTLGALALESDTQPLPPSATQRRRLLLLVLLARAGAKGLTREKIAGFLWAESPENRARHALEQLLYATRQDLGRDSVLSAAGTLRLNRTRVDADVLRFEDALASGAFAEAVSSYSGPFLDGVYLAGAPEFERWVEEERAKLQWQYATALETLAADTTARGAAASAVELWRRLAALDPLSSRYAEGLIRALATRGDVAAALREAQRYEELVRRELDLGPDSSFVALVDSVRQPLAAVPPNPGRHAAGATPAPALSGPTSRSQHPLLPIEPSAPVPPLSPRSGRRTFRLTLAAFICVGALALVARLLPSEDQRAETVTAPAGEVAGARILRSATSHALYLRGRAAWNHRSRDGLEEAIVLFRQATEQDPTNADAFAGLADSYVILGYLGFAPGDATFPKGRAAAQRALLLDPTHGQAYAALGKALQWDHRWAEADEALRRAVELVPNSATGHQWYALLLTILGRMDEAVTHARHAAELDPLSNQIQNTYGITYYHAGMVDSALRVFTRLVTNEPDTAWVRQNPWVLSNFGKVAAAAGRHEDAVRLLDRAVQEVPGHPRPAYDLAVAYIRAGEERRAIATFARADPLHPHHAMYQGLLHASLGELDAAFDWLGRVQDWSPVMVLTLIGDPWPDRLKTDARFTALRQRLGLPQAHGPQGSR